MPPGPPEHTVLGAVHVPPAQHGCEAAPHVTHASIASTHTVPLEHGLPVANPS